jgi:PAS domain S-box-containing protein
MKRINFEQVFNFSPNPYLLLAPDFTIAGMNEAYLRATMREREELMGRSVFEAFPSDPGDPEGAASAQLRASLERAVRDGVPDHLPLIRYDIPRPNGRGFEERYWSATNMPLFDETGELVFVLQHAVDVTELHRLRSLARAAESPTGSLSTPVEADIFKRAQATQEVNRSLEEERRWLHQLFDQAPGFMAVVDGPAHVFELTNRAYENITGGRDVLGRSVREAFPEVTGQGYFELLDQVYATGQPFVGQNMRLKLRQAKAAPEETFLDFIFQPITAEDGAVTGIFIQGHDVTDQHRGQEHLKLVMNELTHRVKNTLAVVQAIATQTFRADAPMAEASELFAARLRAMARGHDLLTEANWEGAGLRDVARMALEAHLDPATERVRVEGPSLRLEPKAALALTMAFHELGTNALKHGALSRDSGSVEIGWEIQEGHDAQRLRLVWREQGGPKVAPPAHRGFGSRLIERALPLDLEGTVRLDYRPEGLLCVIEAPLPGTPAA